MLLPRPLTSDVLREANVFILPQDLCIKYSPFPIFDKESYYLTKLLTEYFLLQMICTFKGPLGVETTCQGDSGGPLVVNEGVNKWTLVGATSFGVSTCEGPYPSMFARSDSPRVSGSIATLSVLHFRVTEFLDFIYASMVPNPFEEFVFSAN